MADDEAYIRLRDSLDSFRNVALAEYAAIERSAEPTRAKEARSYSDFVRERVVDFLSKNKARRKDDWGKSAAGDAQAFEDHAKNVLAKVTQLCPPGFEEKNGVCVPINLL